MPLGAGIRLRVRPPGTGIVKRGPTGELENDLCKPMPNRRSAIGSASASYMSTSKRRSERKDSARLYAKIVASRGRVLSEPETEPGAV